MFNNMMFNPMMNNNAMGMNNNVMGMNNFGMGMNNNIGLLNNMSMNNNMGINNNIGINNNMGMNNIGIGMNNFGMGMNNIGNFGIGMNNFFMNNMGMGMNNIGMNMNNNNLNNNQNMNINMNNSFNINQNSLLKQFNIGEGYYFTFPNNITNIPKIKTLEFRTKISDRDSACLLIKHNEVTPLYLLCSIRESKSFNIIDFEGFEKKDLNYKYNFILEPVRINANISYINEEFYNVGSIYPETLDFSKVDSLKIYLNTDKHFENSIRLNEAGNDIVCEKIEEEKSMFVCKVPKSHFNGAKTGYYLIRQKSRVNGYMAHYETFGVNYALPKSHAKILSSSIFIFGLLCLILF